MIPPIVLLKIGLIPKSLRSETIDDLAIVGSIVDIDMTLSVFRSHETIGEKSARDSRAFKTSLAVVERTIQALFTCAHGPWQFFEEFAIALKCCPETCNTHRVPCGKPLLLEGVNATCK